MSIFTSQFDRARETARAYTGEASETRFWIPAAIAVAVTSAAVATESWGDGWDQGWEAPAAPEPVADDGGAWSHHGDYTDASVGGDEDFLYFIDGDSSLTIG
ncbi:hypothetical protein SAMN05444920_103655 [Nonomuraea solani]|uniref:Uncharacterized protein n=1 Tax=Nonomuraea solani TaxID=1144553 RepID=A0A1H6BU69_9ACTN|nr:hypothetical protein [Nonomuraea solani]SEG64203.1 hypothetical protein SAMN05444920_103655 [Nonomuraea solani]